jgi:hypothetical protein
MLDMFLRICEADLVLTLDSDCFPVAEGWLSDMVNENATVTGISQPWIPPDDSVEGIEQRLRSHLNWNRTHVACQLVSRRFVVSNDLKYSDGDDTGFQILNKAEGLGLKVTTLKPTRCPMSENSDFDPEFNRELSVVFGDKVYHHGSHSRAVVLPYGGFFEVSRKRIEKEGAEWLLSDAYEYRFDMEEKVVEEKMRIMYEMMRDYLLTHNSLFGD